MPEEGIKTSSQTDNLTLILCLNHKLLDQRPKSHDSGIVT